MTDKLCDDANDELPQVTHMCVECRRGYIAVNPESRRPSCLACGGFVTAITTRPNRAPYTNGAFVTEIEP